MGGGLGGTLIWNSVLGPFEERASSSPLTRFKDANIHTETNVVPWLRRLGGGGGEVELNVFPRRGAQDAREMQGRLRKFFSAL